MTGQDAECGVKRVEQPYTLTKNPDEVVTFDPNVSMCCPGSIVQAKSAMQGHLISAQIEDADRADLAVTVDEDPAQWMPPHDAFACEYTVNWVAMKLRWGPAVDEAERDALAGRAAACPDTEITGVRARCSAR